MRATGPMPHTTPACPVTSPPAEGHTDESLGQPLIRNAVLHRRTIADHLEAPTKCVLAEDVTHLLFGRIGPLNIKVCDQHVRLDAMRQ
jgi:hypothetical protein